MAVTTIAVVNQKGGVGKSSCCQHLGGALAQAGHKALLIDIDPQASLTQGFFGPSGMEAIDERQTVVALFDDDLGCRDPSSLLQRTAFDRLTLLPGSPALEPFNNSRPDLAVRLQTSVQEFLVDVGLNFDLALIDCPPNLCLCTWAALLAADFVLVPLQPEDFGSQGIKPVQKKIDQAQLFNPKLQVAGYLLTMVQRLAIHQGYETTLREIYPGRIFAAVIPRAKDFAEAVAARQPVTHYKPRSAAAKAVKAVAVELLGRMTALRQPLAMAG